MPESLVNGEEAERADMLLVWALTPLAASHGVVGLAGLGARPGRALYCAGDLWMCGSAEKEEETECQTRAVQNSSSFI